MSQFSTTNRGGRQLLALLGVGLVYYLLARLGQSLAIEPGNVTPFWPASGFALAAVLLGGYRLWPGVWLGSLLGNTWAIANFETGAAAAATLGVGSAIATGAAFQACVGAYLIRRYCRDEYPFGRVRDVVVFVLTTVVACLISPSTGVTVLTLGGHVVWNSYCYTWLTWYLGDGLGVILTAPLLLTSARAARIWRRSGSVTEALALLVLIVAICVVVFTAYSPFAALHLPLAYLVAIPVLWAALRFCEVGVAVSVGIVGAIAIWGTGSGFGPFETADRNVSLMLLQLFIAHTMVAGLMLTAALAQHGDIEWALRVSEQRTRSVFETAPIGIVLARADGQIEEANPAFCEMLGYTPEELSGMDFLEITHPDDHRASRDLVRRLTSRSMVVGQTEKRYLRKNSSILWSNTVVAPARDERGGIRFMVAMAADITDRKAAETALLQSEEKYRDLFENTRDLIQSVAPDGSITYVNAAWKRTLGYSDEELRGLNIFDIVHPDSVDHCRAIFRRVMEGEAVDNIQAQFVAKDGRAILVEGSTNCRFEDGRPVATRGVYHDVTQLRQDQQELQHYAAELERSNRDLQDFAYVVSHDLQEPLRAITGFCQLLEQKYEGQLDEAADGFIKHIVDGAVRMRTLLTDLLAYSRVHSRGRAFETVDVNDVVLEAMDNLRAQIDESNAEIKCDPLPTIRADPTQLVQLFQNLVGNAIKYSGPQRPAIQITVRTNEDEWIFAVQDNGIGIAPQHADRIFIIFQRLHTRSEYPGTGIGLAVCKRIVERHHGRIWMASEPDSGTTFYFAFPISLLKEGSHLAAGVQNTKIAEENRNGSSSR